MTRMQSGLAAALAALALAAPAALPRSADAADLVVRIEGLRSDDGAVRAALHRRKDGVAFPDSAGIVAAHYGPAAHTRRIVFADLPAGEYAVSLFHDADEDGELDTVLLGLPVEGFGFSNDARGLFGPPGFDAASVTVGEAELQIRVKLDYPES